MTRISPLLPCLTILLAATAAFAEPSRLLRDPDIHGDLVTFHHGGDIWIAPTAGGNARRLTTSEGFESDPHFSPDGKWVAFSGRYAGGADDVYIVPVEGGEPQRLTFHPMPSAMRGWSADGKRVLFSSGRDNAPRFVPRLWSVAIGGGMPEALPLYMAHDGAYSADGARLAYVPVTPAFTAWRNYRGGRTTSIRLVTMDDLSSALIPRENSNDHEPMWIGGDVYFLSDREGTMNLFVYNGASVLKLTHYGDYDIKCAGSDGETIVYERAGYIHQFDPRTGESRQIDIEVRGDFPEYRPGFKKVGNAIRYGALSPTGKRAVFEARGEIVTVPADKGDARNLSQSPGVHDRAPAWSPDGKSIAWFADVDGEYRLLIADQAGLQEQRTIALPDPTFYYNPQWSPDSEKLLFTDKHLNVWVLDVESEELTLVDTDTFSHPQRSLDPVWAPDSKWVAYARRLDNQLRAVFVYSLEDRESHQLTDGLSDAISPAFDASGKYLYFLASTNFALNIGWLDMTSYDRPVSRGVYLAVLSSEESSPLLPESDEEEVKDSDKESDDDKEEAPSDDAEEDDQDEESDDDSDASEEDAEDSDSDDGKDEDNAEDKKKKDKSVRIDFEGLDQRILALDVPERNYVSLSSGAENMVFYAEDIPNASGHTLHRYDVKKRKSDSFMSGVFGYALSSDGKKLLYGARGTWGIVDASGKAKVGDGRLSTGDIEVRTDPQAEWREMYREAWRVMRDFFYDEELHGADWPAMYDKYAPLLPHVRHREDLTHVIEMMLGEVAAGHTRTGGGDIPTTEGPDVGLLGADFTVENGRFRIATILQGENWNPGLRAPLTEPGVDVNEGDYLIAVNGADVTADNVYRAFEGTAGEQTSIRVSANADGSEARDVTVVPLSSDTGLRTRTWMEANRQRVDELSDGKLAYVFLPNTSVQGYQNFNRYYYAQQNKQGVVIDERYNGGGSVADYIVEFLDRPLMSNWATRDGQTFTSPNAAIFGPKVMIINEWAGSGGDYLPYAFRKRGVGPLIGKTTWGGLIGVYDYPTLMDGAYTTAPRVAIYSTDPDNPEWIVENVGVAPDIEVDILPTDVAAGRDPQLERAVEECLRLLEANPVQRTPRPEPINRVNRN